MLILFILSKVAELLQVIWIIYMQRFNIKRPRVFFCAFLEDISSCSAYAFFPAKTACHDTPHNKFDRCIKRVRIITILRIKFNKILIIMSTGEYFMVGKVSCRYENGN